LKLTCDELISSFASNSQGRHRSYVKDGILPVTRREGTSSQFKGVCWNKSLGEAVPVDPGLTALGFIA
jgi:hypothetical protein